MEEESTIEIEPDKLSEKVVDGLVEEGAIEEEEAGEFGDRVWFEESEFSEPVRKDSFLERCSDIASKHYDAFTDTLSTVRNERTVFLSIDSVERTDDDNVRFHVSNESVGERSFDVSSDSGLLANLLFLSGVDNPRNLEGHRIMFEKTRHSTEVLVPENVSLFGRSRYRLYSGVEEIREKTDINRLDGEFALSMCLITPLCAIPASIVRPFIDYSMVLSVALVLPLLVSCAVLGSMAMYGVFRFVLLLISWMSESEMLTSETSWSH